MLAAPHRGDRERNAATGFEGALDLVDRGLGVEVGAVDADHLLDEHLPAVDGPMPAVMCGRVPVEDERWIHLPRDRGADLRLDGDEQVAVGLLDSGLNRSRAWPAVIGATGDCACGRAVSTTRVQPTRTKHSKSAKVVLAMFASLMTGYFPPYVRSLQVGG